MIEDPATTPGPDGKQTAVTLRFSAFAILFKSSGEVCFSR